VHYKFGMSEKGLITDAAGLLPMVQELERKIRDAVLDSCARRSLEELAEVADDAPGDTIYAIDKVSEALLVEAFEKEAPAAGGVVLVAEGLHEGELVLPRGSEPASARFRVLIDPIDGTRGLMYQKRSAWVLAGIAPNRGRDTRLSDIVAAAQTEIPILKQELGDELSAVKGRGAQALRVHVKTGEWREFSLRPSRAESIEHGFAMLTRFFPGGRDVLARLDDEIVEALLGPPRAGKAACFEDQYASTGGQLYELMVGHDRFNADLRPLLGPLLGARGRPQPLCCHPYDLAASLIATEAGIVLTNPDGTPLDAPLDVGSDVAWVGYANAALRARIEPVLRAALRRHGL
jgi:fructose-1,6-bisphosphatase/inositol monophosphatase family enzyme